MARYKDYNQGQGFFQVIDPLAFKRNNKLLSAIDEFVEEYLPVDQFSASVQNDELGAAALDPRLMSKVLFYAIAVGERSYRSIEERLHWDPAFMILSAQKTFDHSTLCRFISRHKKALTDFFTMMVYILMDQGIMSKEFIGIDGTKIKASAGKDFTGTPEDFERRSKKLAKKIEELLATMGSDNPPPDPPKKLLEFQRKKQKIDQFLDEIKKNPGRIRSDEKVNLNDPEARSMKDKDTTYMGYNLQLAVEANHFIVSFDLANCTADQPHLQPMIHKLQKELDDPLTNTVFAFDAGYYSASNILFLEENNLNAYIPEGQAEDGTKVIRSPKTFGSRDCTLINTHPNPVLLCPGNQSITGKLSNRSDRVSYIFSPDKSICKSCNLRTQCYGKYSQKRFEALKISIDSHDARARMKAKVASQKGRAVRSQRFGTGEHVNSEIKDPMGVRQLHCRGKEKSIVFSALTATAYNFRRLAAVS